jgi:hypothetical protein
MARTEKGGITFAAAAHMRSDDHAGPTWAKGEKPIVQATGSRHGMRLIPAIPSRGKMRFMIKESGRVNGAVCSEFPRRLIRGAAREIFLIVDRGSAHRAKKAGVFVQPLGGKLRLFSLY